MPTIRAAVAGASLLVAALVPMVGAVAATATTVWASPSGTGSSCTQAAPCSLTGAQQFVRTALAGGNSGAITVEVTDGTYRLANTWTFSAADSGTTAKPVTWTAAPGAHPVIAGSSQVTGWTQVGSSGIYSASVPAGSATRQLYINGAEASIAQATASQLGWQAGWTGSATGDSFGSDTAAAAWFAALTPAQVAGVEFNYDESDGFWTDSECRVASADATGLTMTQPCWNDTTNRPVVAQGTGSLPSLWSRAVPNVVSNAYALLHPGQWFLDSAANKLYYDPKSGENPMALDVELPKLESLVQVAGTLAAPVHDITFHGLHFSYATWNAPSGPTGFSDVQSNLHITGSNTQGMCTFVSPAGSCPWGGLTQPLANVTLSAADRITMTGNTFSGLGGAGLNIVYGSANNLIQGNEFTDIASTAILLGCTYDPTPSATYAAAIKANCTPNPSAVANDTIGSNEILTGNTVSDNLVHNIGTDYPSACGITLLFSQHTTITHNDIYDVPYSGITAGIIQGHVDNVTHPQNSTNINNDNTISNNLIHDYMQRLQDGGAIYIEGHQAQYVYQADGTTINEAATEANALQVTGNVAYAGGDLNTYYDDAGSEWINFANNVNFDSLDDANANTGCQPTGHFWVTGNYFDGDYGEYFCYTGGVVATDYHVSGNTNLPGQPTPSDLPSAAIVGAGLESAYRSLETPYGASASYWSAPDSNSQVLIAGRGFTTTTPVSFGAKAAAVTYVSQGFLLATVPAGASTTTPTVGAAPSTRFDDTSPYITYSGSGWSTVNQRSENWNGYASMMDFDDTVHSSPTNGDSETLRFTGTGVTAYSELYSDQGNVGVSVDGGTQVTVSTLNNPTTGPRVNQAAIYSVSGLTFGAHTITLTKLSGSTVTMDGFSVPGTPVAPTGRVDDTSAAISYVGSGWNHYTGRGLGDLNDDVHATASNGDRESLTFYGSSVTVYGELSADQGSVLVSIDGAAGTTVSTTSPDQYRYANYLVYRVGGLKAGVHTITVAKASGSWMTADGFTTTP